MPESAPAPADLPSAFPVSGAFQTQAGVEALVLIPPERAVGGDAVDNVPAAGKDVFHAVPAATDRARALPGARGLRPRARPRAVVSVPPEYSVRTDAVDEGRNDGWAGRRDRAGERGPVIRRDERAEVAVYLIPARGDGSVGASRRRGYPRPIVIAAILIRHARARTPRVDAEEGPPRRDLDEGRAAAVTTGDHLTARTLIPDQFVPPVVALFDGGEVAHAVQPVDLRRHKGRAGALRKLKDAAPEGHDIDRHRLAAEYLEVVLAGRAVYFERAGDADDGEINRAECNDSERLNVLDLLPVRRHGDAVVGDLDEPSRDIRVPPVDAVGGRDDPVVPEQRAAATGAQCHQPVLFLDFRADDGAAHKALLLPAKILLLCGAAGGEGEGRQRRQRDAKE